MKENFNNEKYLFPAVVLVTAGLLFTGCSSLPEVPSLIYYPFITL
jgi:hypothetical protein